MPAAEYVPEPTAHCGRCSTGLFYDEVRGAWRTCSPEARVTCPSGGPHQPEELQLDWDNFDEVLSTWEGEAT